VFAVIASASEAIQNSLPQADWIASSLSLLAMTKINDGYLKFE
jgi:hypothetical protein